MLNFLSVLQRGCDKQQTKRFFELEKRFITICLFRYILILEKKFVSTTVLGTFLLVDKRLFDGSYVFYIVISSFPLLLFSSISLIL